MYREHKRNISVCSLYASKPNHWTISTKIIGTFIYNLFNHQRDSDKKEGNEKKQT